MAIDALQMTPAMQQHIKTHHHNQGAGNPRRFAREIVQSGPAVCHVLQAEGGNCPGSHQGDRQPNAKPQYQGCPQRELFQLQANEQYGNGCRAGNESPGQSEQDDLPGGDPLAVKAAIDRLRMRALVGVLPVIGGNPRRLVSVRMMLMRKVAIVMMFMFMFMLIFMFMFMFMFIVMVMVMVMFVSMDM